MGVLSRIRGCGCRSRTAAPATGDGQHRCPISGKTSATGVCPISGQTLKADVVAAARQALHDPLMVAKSQADAETAAELREQGNEKFKKQQYQDAVRLYSEAALLQPRDPSIWLNRCIANRQLKNWVDAEEDAELATELDPTNPKAHYNRALCLQQMDRLNAALASCKAGLEVQSDNKALQQLEGVLKRGLAEKDFAGDRPKRRKDPESAASKATSKIGEEGKRKDPLPAATNGAARPKETNGASKVKDKERAQVTKKPVTADEVAQAQGVDENSCPVSRVNENDLHDIRKQIEAAQYEWKGNNPSKTERAMLKKTMTDMFRQKYEDLASRKQASKGPKLPKTDQYDVLQKQGLQLKGGHQPMERPEHVDLPENFKQPMGVISLQELQKYSWSNPDRRYFISVWGNVFDVSDRPDKYGPDGPYTILTGADITWGLFAGVDTQDYVNKFYDLFKARDMGKDKLAGVCSWLAWYWTEYGDPVAQLDIYQREEDLPAPPLQEVEEMCVLM